MNIGLAAQHSGLPTKTIRYYEDIGLVAPERQDNGYRDYSMSDVHTLQFLQRARGLGFGIADCRNLLELYQDTHRASADVKALAQLKIADVDRKIEELQSLRDTLSHLVEKCQGDDRPDCPIIDDLAGKLIS